MFALLCDLCKNRGMHKCSISYAEIGVYLRLWLSLHGQTFLRTGCFGNHNVVLHLERASVHTFLAC
jgi:hypothetical protein